MTAVMAQATTSRPKRRRQAWSRGAFQIRARHFVRETPPNERRLVVERDQARNGYGLDKLRAFAGQVGASI